VFLLSEVPLYRASTAIQSNLDRWLICSERGRERDREGERGNMVVTRLLKSIHVTHMLVSLSSEHTNVLTVLTFGLLESTVPLTLLSGYSKVRTRTAPRVVLCS